eukprot:Pompholyxophrys_punicea_v1_NODE_441_length_1962_cov_16.704248.p4 type:complete len:118 gc:universal NODE_441_length_1962_cov_16.704248:734-1087(+)
MFKKHLTSHLFINGVLMEHRPKLFTSNYGQILLPLMQLLFLLIWFHFDFFIKTLQLVLFGTTLLLQVLSFVAHFDYNLKRNLKNSTSKKKTTGKLKLTLSFPPNWKLMENQFKSLTS